MWWWSAVTLVLGAGIAFIGNWQSHVMKERRWLTQRIFKARAAHGHDKPEPGCTGCQMADELLRGIHAG